MSVFKKWTSLAAVGTFGTSAATARRIMSQQPDDQPTRHRGSPRGAVCPPSSSSWSEARKRAAQTEVCVEYVGVEIKIPAGESYYVDKKGSVLVGWHGSYNPPRGMDGRSLVAASAQRKVRQSWKSKLTFLQYNVFEFSDRRGQYEQETFNWSKESRDKRKAITTATKPFPDQIGWITQLEVIEKAQADVVGLEEAAYSKITKEEVYADLRKLGYTQIFTCKADHGLHQVLAVHSRQKVVSGSARHLDVNNGDERRCVVAATLEFDGEKGEGKFLVNVGVVHVEHKASTNNPPHEQLDRALKFLEKPIAGGSKVVGHVLMGDFNNTDGKYRTGGSTETHDWSKGGVELQNVREKRRYRHDSAMQATGDRNIELDHIWYKASGDGKISASTKPSVVPGTGPSGWNFGWTKWEKPDLKGMGPSDHVPLTQQLQFEVPSGGALFQVL